MKLKVKPSTTAMDPCVQLQKLGQVAYRRKDYHAALDFFNSVSGGLVTAGMAKLRLVLGNLSRKESDH